jgi:hypothetical protein
VACRNYPRHESSVTRHDIGSPRSRLTVLWPYRSKFPDCLAGAVQCSYRNVDLLWDNVIAGLGMMAPLPVLAKSRPVANPSAGREHSRFAKRVNFQLRNATPRWHGSAGHDAP